MTVSRRHAEFRLKTTEFNVVDVGVSTAPTSTAFVDSAVLANGDEVQIGKFRQGSDRPKQGEDDGSGGLQRTWIAPRWPDVDRGGPPVTSDFPDVTISKIRFWSRGSGDTPAGLISIGGSPHVRLRMAGDSFSLPRGTLPLKVIRPSWTPSPTVSCHHSISLRSTAIGARGRQCWRASGRTPRPCSPHG